MDTKSHAVVSIIEASATTYAVAKTRDDVFSIANRLREDLQDGDDVQLEPLLWILLRK